VGDRVIVNVHNSLGNQSTGLHWHGIHQLGTSHMDGPAHGTQCPIPPGSTFTYDFIVSFAEYSHLFSTFN
jgi:iron transport multicopper oxidase